MPKHVQYFERLFLAAIALAPIITAMSYQEILLPGQEVFEQMFGGSSWFFSAVALITLGLILSLVLLVSRRRSNFAKWTLVITFLIGTLGYIPNLARYMAIGAAGWLSAFQFLAECLGIYFLFTDESRAWFGGRLTSVAESPSELASGPAGIGSGSVTPVPPPAPGKGSLRTGHARTASVTTVSASDEHALWARALQEYESANRRSGLYAKLYAEFDGDEAKVKAAYLKARVAEIEAVRQRQEIEAARPAQVHRVEVTPVADWPPISVSSDRTAGFTATPAQAAEDTPLSDQRRRDIRFGDAVGIGLLILIVLFVIALVKIGNADRRTSGQSAVIPRDAYPMTDADLWNAAIAARSSGGWESSVLYLIGAIRADRLPLVQSAPVEESSGEAMPLFRPAVSDELERSEQWWAGSAAEPSILNIAIFDSTDQQIQGIRFDIYNNNCRAEPAEKRTFTLHLDPQLYPGALRAYRTSMPFNLRTWHARCLIITGAW